MSHTNEFIRATAPQKKYSLTASCFQCMAQIKQSKLRLQFFLMCAFIMAMLPLCVGCESKFQENWGKVHTGMTKEQVENALGPPSSKYEAKEVEGEVVVAEDRWQYGDNLSSLATGAMFPSQPHPRVWAITFGPSGRVSQIQVPDWQQSN